MIFFSLSLFSYAFDCATTAFLQSQKITKPHNISPIVTLLLHPLWCFVLIYYLQLGIVGAGLSYIISGILGNIFLYVAIKRSGCCKESFFLPTAESFQDYKEIAMMAFQSSLLLCFEWWTLEIGTFMAGLLDEIQLSAHISVYHLECWVFVFAGSISNVTITLLGNFLGEKNIPEFKAYARLAPLLGGGLVLGVVIIVMSIRGYAAELFSHDENVVEVTYQLLPYAMVFVCLDALQNLLGAVIKGIGKFDLAIKINVLSYYVVGIPMAYFLAFKAGGEIYGLWLGLISGICCVVVCYLYIVARLDIDKEAQKLTTVLEEEDVVVFCR